MRYLLFLSLIVALFTGYLSCMNSSEVSGTNKPEPVHSVKYVQKSNDWYKKQIELWKKEIDKDSGNVEAWYNYYKANRYHRFENLKAPEKQSKLENILSEMEKHIPDSYEYNYLKACHTPNSREEERMNSVFKAYEIDPERPETYYLMVDYYDLKGDFKKRREFYQKLYNCRDLAPGLLEYNYNVLMSLEANAILITNGDNDTYPAIMLQDVFSIRDDVLVLNISLTKYLEGYLKNRLQGRDLSVDFEALPDKKDDAFLEKFVRYVQDEYPDVPVYFALTVYNEF